MLLFRWLILLLLLAAGVSFSFFIATGQPRFKRGLDPVEDAFQMSKAGDVGEARRVERVEADVDAM